MGLARYASEAATARAAAAFREVFDFVDDTPCRFEWKRRGSRYRTLLEATLGLRFDAIAGGAQRVLEESLVEWSALMHARHGGDRLAVGGGVFMNVRANALVAGQDWVREFFAFPSCGDESNAVGAAYLGYLRLCADRGVAPAPQPFGPAYLGPAIADADVEALLRAGDLARRHDVTEPACMEARIAELLAQGAVVARCAGRMEFGARALGNRSILAHPTDRGAVSLINTMIKNRDFWMPFAPTILRERADDYLENPGSFSSPYMMLTFPTAPEHREEIAAAIHPHDGSARAQILEEAWNPEYHRLIREFERRTGVGAVLNTSFNLHGEPLVCSAEDAVSTFERSGLPHLALGRWLISKRDAVPPRASCGKLGQMIAARLIFILVFAVAFDAGTPLAPPVAAAVEWDEEEEATSAKHERKPARPPTEARPARVTPATPAAPRVARVRASSTPVWSVLLARAHPPAPTLSASAEDH
jgi:carbamoyltransferase